MSLRKLHNIRKKIVTCVLVAVMLAQCAFSRQAVFAESQVYLELTGYQISYALEGYRTLYSIADPEGETEEVGLVYGLTDDVTEEEMIVGSANKTVYSYAGTSNGVSSLKYSSYDGATTYITTMEFIKSVDFYNTSISIRVYAKLKDGSYVYGDIGTMSVYRIAGVLYDKCLMPSIEGHNYLYNDILTLINPEYKFVDYNWGSVIVSPTSTGTKKITGQKETSITAEEETSVVPEETTLSVSEDETSVDIFEEMQTTPSEIMEEMTTVEEERLAES